MTPGTSEPRLTSVPSTPEPIASGRPPTHAAAPTRRQTTHNRLRPAPALLLALAVSGAAFAPGMAAGQTAGQTPPQTPAQAPAQTPPPPPATPAGTVLFSRDLSADPAAPAAPANPAPASGPAGPQALTPNDADLLNVTDAERDALTFTAYDLDLHLTPAIAGISVRATLTLRNDSPVPLTRLILQISSSLHWDSISSSGFATSAATPHPSSHLDFTARRIATDADHTGWMREAVVALPQPLAPGASIALTALYSGAIPASAERLERIGAPAAQAADADWDTIAPANPLASNSDSGSDSNPDSSTHPPARTPGGTALRGFGNVLWYPVAAPPVFLGDGDKLFQAVGAAKLRQSAAVVRLRLAVEYTGDPPDAVFYCGRREPLKAISDNASLPEAESPGVATAVFAPLPLGFRSLSLFLTGHPPTQVDAGPGPAAQSQPDAGLIAAVTDNFAALPTYSAAAALVQPLLADWFGPSPLGPLNLLDHPGQPFEDGALLVRPMRTGNPKDLAPSLAHSLTHAWVHSSRPWIDEGLAQFVGLLWLEQTAGRPAVLAELQEDARALALSEPAAADPGPDTTPGATPQPAATPPPPTPPPPAQTSAPHGLIDASSEVYYRTKAAAVWWMLRDIIGDDALKHALQAYRLDPALDLDPEALERTLEKSSHKDLRWFFNSWVYRDRGLPDLTIVNVTPRQLDARNGQPAGWLVSVEVRNDGVAEAEVPFIVRSAAQGGASAAVESQTLRIPGHGSVSRRMVFAGTPAEVQINDGGVPETRASLHTRQLVLPTR